MNTQYSDVIELVLSLMKSYKIDNIYVSNGTSGESALETFFIPYIKIASGELQICGASIDLSSRDDINKDFGVELTDGEQLIVAKFVLIGYLSSETFNILQMQLHLQDGDFKTYAEQKNLEGKLNALNCLKEEVNYNVKVSGFTSYAW